MAMAMSTPRRRRERTEDCISSTSSGRHCGIDLAHQGCGAAADFRVQGIVRGQEAFELELGQALAHGVANHFVAALEQLQQLRQGAGHAALAKLPDAGRLNERIRIFQGPQRQGAGFQPLELGQGLEGRPPAAGRAVDRQILDDVETPPAA